MKDGYMGNLELRKNANPLWTERHLENVLLFNEAYGLNITDEEIKDQRVKILNGTNDRRVCEGMICYEIYDENIYIGDITVNLLYENPEVDIIIFNEHGGKGYAKKAIQRFIDFEGREFDIIECTVRHNNPNLSKVRSIIEKLGFKYWHSSNDVEVYVFSRA